MPTVVKFQRLRFVINSNDHNPPHFHAVLNNNMKKSAKIELGTGENIMAKNKKNVLKDNELSPKNAKVRITTFIDGDVLLELKRLADKKGIAYQSLLNSILRASTIEKVDFINYQISQRFQMVQQEMESLYKEIKVASKKAKPKSTKRMPLKR